MTTHKRTPVLPEAVPCSHRADVSDKAASGGDVMDDENDKVSQDVVGVKLRNGIHEFQ